MSREEESKRAEDRGSRKLHGRSSHREAQMETESLGKGRMQRGVGGREGAENFQEESGLLGSSGLGLRKGW